MVLISCLISGRPGISADGPSLPGDVARDLGEEPGDGPLLSGYLGGAGDVPLLSGDLCEALGDGLLSVEDPGEALGDGLLSVEGPGEALGDGLLSVGGLTRSLLSKRGFLLGVSDQSELTARLS